MSRITLSENLRWLALLAVTLPVGDLLYAQGFPAAWLVGSMLCAIAFSVSGLQWTVPRKALTCAQALIGCAVANSISASILLSIVEDWPVMLLVVGGSVLAGGLVGWLLVRSRLLPGTTAAWGSTPGGAAAMVIMAEEYGADVRLVALMQYLRVIVVVLLASFVAHFLMQERGAFPAASSPFVWGSGQDVACSLAVALIGGLAGKLLRLPAGAMLFPMFLGAALHSSGWIDFHLPFWLQAAASVTLGWYVGLGFGRQTLLSAYRILPRLLLSAILLIGLCLLLAVLLVKTVAVDPLTAYLATSPGGLDSVILIAIGSQADIPFVVAVQTLRLFVVILTGPMIARLICRHAHPSADPIH